MFSIVMPLYNKAQILDCTINSVISQTHHDLELVIINDGSTDNSQEVVNNFNDPRIKVIHQTNAGVSAARNTGIKQASGDWIAFLDADDWWHPEYLSVLKKTIDDNPKALAVSTAFFSKADNKNWEPKPWKIDSLPEVEIITNLPKRWMQGIPFFTSSFCVKKSLLQTLDTWFVEGESNGEDVDLWLRIAEKTAVYNLPTQLVVYRTEQNTSLMALNINNEEPFFLNRIRTRANSKRYPPELKNSSIELIYQYRISLTRLALQHNERKKALIALWKIRECITLKRWWVTLFMALFIPSKTITKWQNKKNTLKELSE